MPSIIVSRKQIEKSMRKKLGLKKLKDRISMLGTDLEKIDGDEIHVEVFPDRPDMLSEQGFARALSGFIGVKNGLSNYKVSKHKSYVNYKKPLKEWPYVVSAVVKGLDFDDAKIRDIIQVQEKLHASILRNRKKGGIGIYPMDKIHFPITLNGEDPDKLRFRPLEHDIEITGRQVFSKHKTGRAYSHICEAWPLVPVFRDAENKVLSMPPIINSHDTGKINEKTKDVFIECTGRDIAALQSCLNIIVTTLAEMGGKVLSLEMRYPHKTFTSPDLTPKKMVLDIDYANAKLGLQLSQAQAKSCLEKMGHGTKTLGKRIEVQVPCYRTDVLHQIDLVEDIAKAYGYENFEAEIPKTGTIGEENDQEIFNRKICDVMVGLGFLESNTYHLISKESHEDKMNCGLKGVRLLNSQTKEYNTLRAWLIPGLLNVLSENKHHEYPQNIFDIGTVFKHTGKGETGIEEYDRLAVLMCGKDAEYTKIKQVLDVIMRSLDKEYVVKATKHDSFIPGRVARILVEGKKVAYAGEIHPTVLDDFEIHNPVAALELNLTELNSIIAVRD